MEDQEIKIVFSVDDQQLFDSLDQVAGNVEAVEGSADKLGKSLKKAGNQAKKSFDDAGKEIDDTGKKIKRATQQNRSFTSSLRRTQRQVSLIKNLALGGLFTGIFSGVTDAIQGVRDGLNFVTKSLENYEASNNSALKTQLLVNDQIDRAAKGFFKERQEVQALFKPLDDDNISRTKKRELIDKINTSYGEYLPKLLTEKSTTAELATSLKAVNRGLAGKFALQAQEAKIAEITQKITEEEVKFRQNAAKVTARITDESVARSNRALGLTQTRAEREEQVTAKIREGTDTRIALLIAEATAIKKSTDAVTDALVAAGIGFDESTKELNDDVKKSQAELNKEIADARKKELDAQKKSGTRRAQERDREAKALLKQQQDFLKNELKEAESRAKILSDIERQTVETTLEDREDGLAKSLALEDDATAQRIAKLKAQSKEFTDQAKIQQAKVDEAFKAGSDKSLEVQTKLGQEQIKIDKAVAKAIEVETTASENRKIELRKEFATKEEELEKELADKKLAANEVQLEAEIELAEANLQTLQTLALNRLILEGATEEEITKLKEDQEKARKILELTSNKRRLEAALKNGQQLTQIERDSIRAQISAIEAELDGFGAKGKRSLLDILGIEITDEQISALKDAAGQVLEFVNAGFQQRIDASAAVVSAKDTEIDRLEESLARELELREAGLANNAEAIQRDIKVQEEARKQALKEQQQAARQQFALETAIQAVNLATSATEIIKAFSAIPIVGVPLGIAAVGVMIAGFIKARSDAFRATRLAEGGQIPGPEAGGRSDKNGGRGHRIEDTNIVVGGNEWVTNAQDSVEQSEILRRINAGEFRGMNLADIVDGNIAASKGIRSRVVQKQLAKQRRSDYVQSNAIKSAIEQQTEDLQEGMAQIYYKPSISATEEGYIKSKPSKNGFIIEKIKTR
jgi:hypothetical protein